MANFKLCVRSKRKDGLLPVFVRVVHRKSVAYIRTGLSAAPQTVKRGDVDDVFVMRQGLAMIDDFLKRLGGMDLSFMTAADIKRFLERKAGGVSFSDFADGYIDRMLDKGQVRNAKIYSSAVRSLSEYVGGEVSFGSMSYQVLSGWIDSLGGTKRAKSLYPICVRQIYREACRQAEDVLSGVSVPEVDPWRRIRIPASVSGDKRAVSAEVCRMFFSWTAGEGSCKRAQLGRDVALMSLCLAGMNTVDIYQLRKGDFYGGVLHYCRSKTRGRRKDKAYFEIRVPNILTEVFERYRASEESDYLFCFAERYADASVFNVTVNDGIKAVCAELGLEGMSFYAFRHTWATTAQNDCGANLAEVGFAMNHSQHHSTTRGYVRIDFRPAWELNEKVIDFILFSDKPSSRTQSEQQEESLFRISPKMLIRACAFFRGRCVASFEDIGCGKVDEVIARLVGGLPDDIPVRSMVQFKIVNLDNGKVATYERMKGKGF